MAKAHAVRSPSSKGVPSNSPRGSANQATTPKKSKTDYTSDGVEDNDVFLLPAVDYQVMAVVTIVGAIVRLFRIYQPTSVVFDEVQ
jgi:dolichyl-phosphate-mannose-protein mannosyltransferase